MKSGNFIRVYKAPWADNLQVLLVKHEMDKVYVATNVEFKEANPAEIYEPTMYLHYEDAQELMDSLWTCGLRPSEGSGSAGALTATQKHLEDMRKLVFDFVEKSK